jgi:tRNA(fMet)-specific endonuclease VapC
VKYIFDTNVCIQILKGKSEILKNRIENISTSDIIIPSIVRFELFYGAYKSSNPDKTLAVILDFIQSFETLDFNDLIAEKAGEIRSNLDKIGKPIGPYDLLIAATAIISNLILVSNNVKEFERVPGLQLEDWQS